MPINTSAGVAWHAPRLRNASRSDKIDAYQFEFYSSKFMLLVLVPVLCFFYKKIIMFNSINVKPLSFSVKGTMTAFLPPNLMALFEARPPIPYLPPPTELLVDKNERLPEVRIGGVAECVRLFEVI